MNKVKKEAKNATTFKRESKKTAEEEKQEFFLRCPFLLGGTFQQ